MSMSTSMSMETHIYKIVAGCQIRADVYRPQSEGPAPVIVWIHGGGLICGSRKATNPHHVEAYVRSGYTVVSIDHRLAPETKAWEIIEDVVDAHRWVREEGPRLFGGDPERVATVGHSAGAYLALCAGAHVSPKPRALAAWYGASDLTGEWCVMPSASWNTQPPVPKERADAARHGSPISEGVEGRGDLYVYCRQQGTWIQEVTGLDPRTQDSAFDPLCPIRNVAPDYPPTILLHGKVDHDVPCEESARMAEELDRAGVDNELFIAEGHDHGFDCNLDDPPSAEALAAVLRFLDRHLHRR